MDNFPEIETNRLVLGRFMIKNGMIKEGELKENMKKAGSFKSLIQCRMTKEEFNNMN